MRNSLCFLMFFFSFWHSIFSQKFEISSAFIYAIPIKMEMPNFPRTYSPSFGITYFPKKSLPIGLEIEYSFSRYQKFSAHYNFSSGENPSNNSVIFKNKFNRTLFGLKFFKQEQKSRISPFLSVMIGNGTIKSIINKTKTEYSYELIEVEDDEGEITYEEEGYSTSSVQKEKLVLSKETIYSIRSGLIFVCHRSYPVLAIQASSGYTGSFIPFKYNVRFNPTHRDSYETVKTDFQNNAKLNKSKLSLVHFSFGLLVKF